MLNWISIVLMPPQNTIRAQVTIGHLDLLFSRGDLIAFQYRPGSPMLRLDVDRHQLRHANQWRDWRTILKIEIPEFQSQLLAALRTEITQLSREQQ